MGLLPVLGLAALISVVPTLCGAQPDTSSAPAAPPLAAPSASSPPDTLTGPPASDSQSLKLPRTRGDAPRKPPPPAPPFSAPRWVMLRSALIPGWGQLHNRSWIKAAGVAAGEGLLISRIVDDTRELDRLERAVEEARAAGGRDAEADAVDAFNARLTLRTARGWWLAAVVSYSLLDAYIDAHFRGFSADFAVAPAPPGSGGAASALEPRLALRWSF